METLLTVLRCLWTVLVFSLYASLVCAVLVLGTITYLLGSWAGAAVLATVTVGVLVCMWTVR